MMKVKALDLNDLILNFLPDLIGAFFGAYLGYRYGMKQEREVRKEEEKEVKRELKSSLSKEIKDNETQLKKGLIDRNYKGFIIKYIEAILSTDAFDSSIFSGVYRLLSVETQRKVTWYYRGCKRLNDYAGKLEYSDIDRSLADYFSNEIRKLHDALLAATEDIIQNLN